jgi:hypothetical protein
MTIFFGVFPAMIAPPSCNLCSALNIDVINSRRLRTIQMPPAVKSYWHAFTFNSILGGRRGLTNSQGRHRPAAQASKPVNISVFGEPVFSYQPMCIFILALAAQAGGSGDLNFATLDGA